MILMFFMRDRSCLLFFFFAYTNVFSSVKWLILNNSKSFLKLIQEKIYFSLRPLVNRFGGGGGVE